MKTTFRLSCFLTVLIMVTAAGCRDDKSVYVQGVSSPVISLDGTWQAAPFSYDSLQLIKEVKWKELGVPGECMMQGFPVKHDVAFTYRKEIDIPADYEDKLVKLRFEGVYSYARVWVNNTFIRDHWGGFTAWECDITPAVRAGEKAVVFVEVTDRADEISYASGYATHQIGGILRSVSLLALPQVYPESVSINTDFDENYRDAVLKVEGQTNVRGIRAG